MQGKIRLIPLRATTEIASSLSGQPGNNMIWPCPSSGVGSDHASPGIVPGVAANEPRAGQKIVWIIDDSPTIRALFCRELMVHGLHPHAFHHGEEALSWYAAHDQERPDLIYVDVALPGMDGYEVVRQCRSFSGLQQTPIFLLSGEDGATQRSKGRRAGADGYLAKSCRGDLLAATLACLQLALVQMRSG